MVANGGCGGFGGRTGPPYFGSVIGGGPPYLVTIGGGVAVVLEVGGVLGALAVPVAVSDGPGSPGFAVFALLALLTPLEGLSLGGTGFASGACAPLQAATSDASAPPAIIQSPAAFDIAATKRLDLRPVPAFVLAMSVSVRPRPRDASARPGAYPGGASRSLAPNRLLELRAVALEPGA